MGLFFLLFPRARFQWLGRGRIDQGVEPASEAEIAENTVFQPFSRLQGVFGRW
jgi:hypothetical protein